MLHLVLSNFTILHDPTIPEVYYLSPVVKYEIMMFPALITTYILPLTAFMTLSFAIAIMLGFEISLWGDALAVILVGLGSISVQAFLLPLSISTTTWIVYSAVGTTIGVAIAFLLIKILVELELVGLDNSHVVTFPLILTGLVISQFIIIQNTISVDIAFSWMLFSIIGWSIPFFLLAFFARSIGFDIEILKTRERKYSAIPKWGLIGFVFGICYTVFTSFVLIQ